MKLGCLNTLRPRQNGRLFADHAFKCIFLNENVWILLKISLKFVPKGPINNIPSLVQVMAWCRPGDKTLSELMMVSLLTHTCVAQPQWVKLLTPGKCDSNLKSITLEYIFWIDFFGVGLVDALMLAGHKPYLPEPILSKICLLPVSEFW